LEKGEASMWVVLLLIFLLAMLPFIVSKISLRGWKCIYVAIGYNQYFKIVGELKAHGVPFKTNTPFGFDSRQVLQHDNKQYEIFVKESDVGRANKAIHSS
jgi:hypothetical protein